MLSSCLMCTPFIQLYKAAGNGCVSSPPSYVYIPCGESEPEAERLSINDLPTHQV